jgi:hypothetical protein
MSKALCIFGMVISALLVAMFFLDLATSFLRANSKAMDIGFIIAAGILGYLSWVTFREQP